MSTSGRRRLAITQQGEGERLEIGHSTLLTASCEWTSGAYCVMEQLVAPRSLVPAHTHATEDQALWVLSGALTVWVDGDEVELHEGGYAFRPAGLPHSMWNQLDEPVRILEITNPGAGFERYMRALSELNASGEARPETVAKLASGAGITFLGELTKQLVARTGLSTAGGFWKKSGE